VGAALMDRRIGWLLLGIGVALLLLITVLVLTT
jgi:hypothetical protein